MTVREWIHRTEYFPVNTCVVFVGCDQGCHDRSATQNSNVAFAVNPGVHLCNRHRRQRNERLALVTEEVDPIDDLVRPCAALS